MQSFLNSGLLQLVQVIGVNTKVWWSVRRKTGTCFILISQLLVLISLPLMPSLSKEVKSTVDSFRLSLPLEQLLSSPDTKLIKQGAEAVQFPSLPLSLSFTTSDSLRKGYYRRYTEPTYTLRILRLQSSSNIDSQNYTVIQHSTHN